MKPRSYNPKWMLYRALMRLAHRFNWHRMDELGPFEDGTKQLWCTWCGARHTIPQPMTTLRRVTATKETT